MAVVGGNLADMASNVGRLREAGASAVASADETTMAVRVLDDSIRSATADVVARFEAIATELKAQISHASRQLHASDWQGRSREHALQIEATLSGHVDRVITTATGSLESEATAFGREPKRSWPTSILRSGG